MFSHPHPKQPLVIGALQHRRRSLDQYGDLLARRYRREPYELEQRIARRHYSEPPQPSYKSGKVKSLDEATIEIVKHIDSYKDVISATIRHERKQFMRKAADLSGVLRHWARVFDGLFFKGALHHHVRLNLDDKKGEIFPDCGGKTKVSPDATGTTVILCLSQLQAVFQRKGTGIGTDYAYATLLHQLIHAYFMVTCGIQNDGKDPDGRLKHGEHFGCLMYKIRGVFSECGAPIPLDFGHSLPVGPRRAAMIEPTRDALYRINDCRNTRKYSTECPRDVEVIKEDKINDWYKKKCIKAVDPDIFEFNFDNGTVDSKPSSKCGNKKDWVELVHSKKSYKLDRKALGFPYLKKKFEDDKRKLDIPSWVDLEVFQSLMSFLIRGEWSPDLSDVQNGTEGPPLLLKNYHNAMKHVQHDIAVYQLGCCLHFDDLKRHALTRLTNHHFTHESGHDIVRAIYYDAPSPADEPLRTWAREFFKRHSEPQPGSKPIDCSNWKVLQDDIVFRARFSGSGYGNMKSDMNKAETELRKMEDEVPTPIDPYATHVCTAHCTYVNCLMTYYRVYPQQRHHTLAPPPPPPPATYIPPPTYVPPLPPHQSAITYPASTYPRPHIAPPASLSHPNQQSDYSWIAKDPAGRPYILESHMERWMPYYPDNPYRHDYDSCISGCCEREY
jgi:hypothetical protein